MHRALLFGRKRLSGSQKGLTIAAKIVTGIYLALIAWLVVMWG